MRALVCTLVLTSLAAAGEKETREEYMKLARLALEAQLRIGDILHAKGDYDGAAEAYRKAGAVYGGASKGGPAPARRGKKGIAVPEEEIVEKPIETGGVQDHNEVDVEAGKFREAKRRARAAEAEAEAVRRAQAHAAAAFQDAGKQAFARRSRGYGRLLRREGGSGLTENAVELGLKWLADHQDKDGKWSASNFNEHDPADDKCDGAGGRAYDAGVTALATVAFLGAGYHDRGGREAKRYARQVGRALKYLLAHQDEGGIFGAGTPHAIHQHALATLALCEAFAMTGDAAYRKAAQRGLDAIAKAKPADIAGTSLCVLALKAGRLAGLRTSAGWMTNARDAVAAATVAGRVPNERPADRKDRFPPEKSEALTAAGALVRILAGEDPRTSKTIREQAGLCLAKLPAWNPDDGSIDMAYWFLGSSAIFQLGGASWRRWNEAMKEAITKHQHPKGSGARTGSWDPIGVWGPEGGRVYSTALMVLTLETYYRYPRFTKPLLFEAK